MSQDLIHIPELLGQNLRKLRIIKEITVENAAHSAGISKSFLSLLENGKRSIKTNDLKKILSVYGYTLGKFLSLTQDSVKGFDFKPNSIVQKRSQSILLEGSRNDGDYRLLLLRPIRHDKDIEVLELYLPPKTDMNSEHITIPAEIKGIVQEGKLLLDLKEDEETVLQGEEFCIEGNTPHIFRNYWDEPALIFLIVYPPII